METLGIILGTILIILCVVWLRTLYLSKPALQDDHQLDEWLGSNIHPPMRRPSSFGFGSGHRFKEEERRRKVAEAQRHFEAMLSDSTNAPHYAKKIRTRVADGTTSWEELGFTNADVDNRLG